MGMGGVAVVVGGGGGNRKGAERDVDRRSCKEIPKERSEAI